MKNKKNDDKLTLLMQDYRMMIENQVKNPSVVEPIVEYFSYHTLEELEEIEKIYTQNKILCLTQKQHLGSYTISMQDPLDIEYILNAIRSVILTRYANLVGANIKTIEVLKPLFEEKTDYSKMAHQELEDILKDASKNRIKSITHWITFGGMWASDEEYNRFCDSCTELNIVNEEIKKRNSKKLVIH